MCDRGRGDPEIVRTDELTALGELRPYVCVNTSHLFGDRDGLQPGKEMLDKGAAASASSPGRAMNSVQQLADSDHADRSLLLANQPIDRRRADAALEINQQVSVDQDGHDGSGGATVSRS